MKPRHVVAICFEVVGLVALCVGLWRLDWHLTAFATCMFVMSVLVVASGALRDRRRDAASFRR